MPGLRRWNDSVINNLLSFFLEAERARSLAVTSLDNGYTGSFEVQLTADQSSVAYEGCSFLLHHACIPSCSCSRKCRRRSSHRSRRSRDPRLLILLFLRLHVQPTQISLPSNRNDASEDTPVLRCHEGEAECRDCRPQFPAISPTRRHRIYNSLLCLCQRLS